MKGFYRYIYEGNNKFRILKNNEFLIEFDELHVALAHRDALEECDWNWDLYIEKEIDENKYINEDLPVFSHHDLKYIFNEYGKCRGKKPYAIKKYFNGKLKRFGRYRTVDEAITMRDALIECNWCDVKTLKKEKREKT